MNAITSVARVSAATPRRHAGILLAPARASGAVTGRHVAVLLDASPDAANAAWRGALVARDRGLPLHLVAVHPLHADHARAANVAESLAAEVRTRLGLKVTSQAIAGTREHEGVQATAGASLLVLPVSAQGGSWLLGFPVMRVLRRARRPVLLVRTPAQMAYLRVLAAVELDRAACSLIAAARALSRGPRVKVLHVLDHSQEEEVMRLAGVRERGVLAQRERDAGRARGVLAELMSSAGARDDVESVVAFGPAADVVMEQQLEARADLLVLGKQLRPAWMDALRPSVGSRILRAGTADVLVLPTQPLAPTERWPVPEFAR